MTRKQYFRNMANHPLRSKDMASFNQKELAFAEEFINKCIALSPGNYVQALNRLMIDDDRVRITKRISLWSCLLEAATQEFDDFKKGLP